VSRLPGRLREGSVAERVDKCPERFGLRKIRQSPVLGTAAIATGTVKFCGRLQPGGVVAGIGSDEERHHKIVVQGRRRAEDDDGSVAVVVGSPPSVLSA
jgi:hypothetical protein